MNCQTTNLALLFCTDSCDWLRRKHCHVLFFSFVLPVWFAFAMKWALKMQRKNIERKTFVAWINSLFRCKTNCARTNTCKRFDMVREIHDTANQNSIADKNRMRSNERKKNNRHENWWENICIWNAFIFSRHMEGEKKELKKRKERDGKSTKRKYFFFMQSEKESNTSTAGKLQEENPSEENSQSFGASTWAFSLFVEIFFCGKSMTFPQIF